jgi:hypothetical protein
MTVGNSLQPVSAPKLHHKNVNGDLVSSDHLLLLLGCTTKNAIQAGQVNRWWQKDRHACMHSVHTYPSVLR